ncbi:MAG TPA: hypothetical protein PKO23_05680 [Candidatus Hydrogenedentes bacterium]|nr:hypothetical protein [Candidatus Hydrogenedentota bacterium]
MIYNTIYTGMSLLLFSAAGVFSGCGVELLSTAAVESELQARNAKAATQQLDLVKKRVGAINVSQAIQTYRAENGAPPPSLEDLVPKYLAAVPRKADGTPYFYDPATGTVSETPVYNNAAATADQQMINEIKNAIQRYGTATGYYPPTLDALYPAYLSQMPRTSTGGQFMYNNQNGDVRLPGGSPVAPARAGSGAPPGMPQLQGGGGNAGATAVRSQARGNITGITDQQTDRQNRVMDDLGL